MRTLDQLLITDMKRMWRQCLAIAILVACGIATFVMSTSTIRSLDTSMDSFYTRYHFGDVFLQLVRAPNRLSDRLSEVPGVQRVETRIVRPVILDVPDMPEPATGKLVSIRHDPDKSLNGVFLLRGRLPNSEGPPEILASEPFADAHNFNPGDQIEVTMGGRREQLLIVGIAISPEFIYAVQPGLLLTDNRRFGVFWMPHRQMEAAFNMEGAFNDAVLTLQAGANVKDVMYHCDRLTEPYGGVGAHDRHDQSSHHRVADEMQQLGSLAFVTPSIFLAVSAFLFNIVMSRMVHQQKEQIATLRAFGYDRREIGIYYMKFLTILVSVGAVAGCLVGMRLSWWMTDQYVRFFRFPTVEYELGIWEALVAIATGFAAASAGSFLAIRRAVRLPAVVAMRPEPPATFQNSLLERFGFGRFLSTPGRMIIRRFQGNRRATVFSVLGMALGLAVVVLGSFFDDTIEYVLDAQFQRAQRQDVMLTFYETRSIDALQDVQHLPGVISAEPFRSVPARLRHGIREHRLSIMGLEARPVLFRVLDQNQTPIELPPRSGLTISKKLSEILDVELNETLTVDVLEGKRRTCDIPVVAIFPDYSDPGAFMNRRELHRLLSESEQISGAFLLADPTRINEMYASVKQIPAIAGVLDKNAAFRNFRKEISENTYVMRIVNAMFAFIIAFGVIYNCALITLAERNRDLATLRIMGYYGHEISFVLIGELAIITLLSIPVGLLIGYGFAYMTTLALDTETHRFPLVISRYTFAYSTCFILMVATVTSLYVRRKLDKLDLVAVMKVKE